MRVAELYESEHPLIQKVSNEDISILKKMVITEFGHMVSLSEMDGILNDVINWNISVKLTLNNRIIGCYLLSDRNIKIPDNCDIKIDLRKFDDLRGVEGVALIILPEYRKLGYGNMLKNVPKQLGFDYVWGEQLHDLDNLDMWLKRRELIAVCSDMYVTAEMFTKQ